MSSRKNSGIPKREANIDGASLNLLIAVISVTVVLIIILASYLTVMTVARGGSNYGDSPENNDTPVQGNASYPFKADGIAVDLPSTQEAEFGIPEADINSKYALLVDITDNKIIASRQGETVIYPASMTKVMSLIVIAENLQSEAALNEVLTLKSEVVEKMKQESANIIGLNGGEKLTVEDLIYATILQSDGTACLTLAEYIAGSEANFVTMMNEKAREMGLSDKTTLFQNCTGLHHDYHYSTCKDIATIMAYAMKNPFCSKILSSLKYYPSDNFRKGEGNVFYHSLLVTHLDNGNISPKKADIIAGKTGVTEKTTSGHCIVTYAMGDNGHFYVSVTAKAGSFAANVDDIKNIYNEYIK